jgi:rRNA processing protein Gar1
MRYPTEYGEFLHPCENDMVFKTKMCDKIPKFNAPIFLENKVMIGTVDEVFGPVNDVVCTEHHTYSTLSHSQVSSSSDNFNNLELFVLMFTLLFVCVVYDVCCGSVFHSETKRRIQSCKFQSGWEVLHLPRTFVECEYV